MALISVVEEIATHFGGNKNRSNNSARPSTPPPVPSSASKSNGYVALQINNSNDDNGIASASSSNMDIGGCDEWEAQRSCHSKLSIDHDWKEINIKVSLLSLSFPSPSP
jgi:hypothetical protein